MFSGDGPRGYGYVLHEQQVLEADDQSRLLTVAVTLPDTPPDQETFQHWVDQSINQSALSFLQNLLEHYRLAAACGACLGLDCPLALDVLKALHLDGGGIPEATLNTLVDLNLPFLNGLDLDTLVRIRVNEGEAFAAFRRALESASRELRLEADADRLRVRKQNLVHQLTEVEIPSCANKIGALRRSGTAETAVAVLGLAGAFHSAGWSLLAALMAMVQGYRTYETYRSQVKATPGYFLWRLHGG
jgi:hypothetical protein